LNTFLSAEIAAFSINIHVSSFNTAYNFRFIVRDGSVGLLLLVPLLSQLISVDFVGCLYRSSVSNFTLFPYVLRCSAAEHTHFLSCHFICTFFSANTVHAVVMLSASSSFAVSGFNVFVA